MSGQIVDDRVPGDLQARTRVNRALLTKEDHYATVRPRSFLDDVVLDRRVAAIRQVDAEAGRASRSVNDARVFDNGIEGTAFDLMTLIRIEKVAVINRQRRDIADIDIVCKAKAGPGGRRTLEANPVVGEHGVVDSDTAGVGDEGITPQAILIIEEVIVVEDEVAAFVNNPGAVSAEGGKCRRPGKREIVDRIVAVRDKHALAEMTRGDQIDHPAEAFERDVFSGCL